MLYEIPGVPVLWLWYIHFLFILFPWFPESLLKGGFFPIATEIFEEKFLQLKVLVVCFWNVSSRKFRYEQKIPRMVGWFWQCRLLGESRTCERDIKYARLAVTPDKTTAHWIRMVVVNLPTRPFQLAFSGFSNFVIPSFYFHVHPHSLCLIYAVAIDL